MKRLFFFFLITLLPLQLSAALLEGYQNSEMAHSAQTQHVEHNHTTSVAADLAPLTSAVDDATADHAPDNGCAHLECGVCHLACCPILPGTRSLTRFVPLRTLAVAQGIAENSIPQAPPYRPNW